MPTPDSASAMAEENRWLNEAQAISQVGSWSFDPIMTLTTMSATMLHLHGLTWTQPTAGPDALFDCVHGHDRAAVQAALNDLMATSETVTVRYRTASEQPLRWMQLRARALRDGGGQVSRIFGTAADISEHVQAESELRAANEALVDAYSFQQAVITASPDAIHIYDVATATISRANLVATEFIGFTPEMVSVMAGLDLPALLPPEDLREYEQTLQVAVSVADGQFVQLRHRVYHRNQPIRWLSRRLTPFQRSAAGEVTRVLIVTRDVSNVVEVEERLEHAALHDDLTGLANRRLVVDRLDHALALTERQGLVAVLFCDLDGFKEINDTHGHHAGDQVLIETANRLLIAIRNADTVGRVGGDEFVIILEIPDEADAAALADTIATRVETAIAEPIVVDGGTHRVSASIGIRIAGRGARSRDVINDADTAMYWAKTHGRNRHYLFHPGLKSAE